MTITYGAYGRPVALDLEDTVTFHHPIGEATQRLATVPTTPRRPNINPHFEQRRSFASPGSTGEQPLIGINPDETAVIDELQARFNQYWAGERAPKAAPKRHRGGRHHKPVQPGLLARLFRLFGFGRRDGV